MQGRGVRAGGALLEMGACETGREEGRDGSGGKKVIGMRKEAAAGKRWGGGAERVYV